MPLPILMNKVFDQDGAGDKLNPALGQLPLTGGNLTGPLTINNETVAPIKNSAAAHNAIFRGENLLSHFASIEALSTQVKAGNFENIFIGDYIDVEMTSSVGGTETVRWCVAGIDLYYNRGDTAITQHHLVMIAEDLFQTPHVMNDTNITTGGFVGSRMWTEFIPAYNTAIRNSTIGAHAITFRTLLSKSVNTSTASGAGAGWTGCSNSWAWTDAILSLPSEVQVYGCRVLSSSLYDVGERNQQFPYFALRQDKLVAKLGRGGSCCYWWLSAVACAGHFARVNTNGSAYGDYAGNSWMGIRPYFLFS